MYLRSRHKQASLHIPEGFVSFPESLPFFLLAVPTAFHPLEEPIRQAPSLPDIGMDTGKVYPATVAGYFLPEGNGWKEKTDLPCQESVPVS